MLAAAHFILTAESEIHLAAGIAEPAKEANGLESQRRWALPAIVKLMDPKQQIENVVGTEKDDTEKRQTGCRKVATNQTARRRGILGNAVGERLKSVESPG